jgi:hypothetical protein
MNIPQPIILDIESLTIEDVEKSKCKNQNRKMTTTNKKGKTKKYYGNKSFPPSKKKSRDVSRVRDSVMWWVLSGNLNVSFILNNTHSSLLFK